MDPRAPGFWSAYLLEDSAGSECPVHVTLPWDAERALVLRADELGKSLELVEPGGAASPLGWWDDARWHPFALRWAELDALADQWRAHPDVTLLAPIPLLLLAPFVGFGVGDEAVRAVALDRVARGLASLGVGDVDACAARALLPVTDDDYRWTLDAALGWTFGGAYPCYSLRNSAHAGGAEGRFPFEAFRQRFVPGDSRG